MATLHGAAANSAAHVAYEPPCARQIDGHVRAVTPCSVSSVSTSSADHVSVSTTNSDDVQFGPADGAGYGLPGTLNGLLDTADAKLDTRTSADTQIGSHEAIAYTETPRWEVQARRCVGAVECCAEPNNCAYLS